MNLLAQRHTIDKLHGDEIHPIALTNFMDRRDVGMIKGRGSFRLLSKPPHSILVASKLPWQNLQRHLPIKLRVLRQIHLAHTAFAELGNDAVMRQCAIG